MLIIELHLTSRKAWLYLLCALIIAAAMSAAPLSFAQPSSPVMTQEYFIQQSAGEDLLITISAFEAEFESRISGPNAEVLLLSGVPGSRIIPVFQYVPAPKNNRQLDIEVTSSLYTGRTEFGIELTRLKPWDSRSSSLSQAYQLLSFGTESGGIENQANWTVKIESLVNAGRLFQQLGMQEMRLWANYLAAHLVEFHLHDHSIVFSMTREILTELKGTRLQKIELATLQLQSLALNGLIKSGSLSSGTSGYDSNPLQTVLSRIAELAETNDFLFEQALALYASGVDYAGQAFYPNALEQFQRAVQIADAVGSADLAKTIRESILQVHTVQGDAPATTEVLQEIESQLVEEGGGDELALNLLAQARLLLEGYHYSEALKVLSGALSYENNSAIRSQINFEMAVVFYETGRWNDALTYLQLAEVKPDSGQKKRLNPVVDLAQGLGILANIQRSKGEFGQMRESRTAQGHYQAASDQYFYDQGLDAIAPAGADKQRAASLFRQSMQAAKAAAHVDLEHLARMQYCVLAENADGLCTRTALADSYEWLTGSGVPGYSAEAMFLRSKLLLSDGLRDEAISVLERLADDIHMLRHSLAGVLGAWYWERHEEVFTSWLKLLVNDSRQRGGADDTASMLALSKIRFIEGYPEAERDLSGVSKDTDRLRSELYLRAQAGAGSSSLATGARINTGLEKLRADFQRKFSFLSVTGLQKYLRNLGNDEVVLTYHLSAAMAQVWIGRRSGVQRRDIANPAEVYRTVQEARQGLGDSGLDSFNDRMDILGKLLVEPFAGQLAGTIYWIASGPLLGFPVDALRVKGRYLIERHNVSNLLSFPENADPANGLQSGPLQKVFVAGNPQNYSGDYATRLETSAEIQTVADIFVGPGLQIIQGVALLPDEFQTGHFLESNLIHLSMPGLINLQYPPDSGLELSESEYEPGRVPLRPENIRSQELSAALVFLSSTRFTGNPPSDFSTYPGLVADFMSAGAGSVIANLWAGESESNRGLVADYYRSLQASGNIADSMRESRLRYLKNNRETGLYDWAGYQLYIP
jgi:CHAT domain-containing protein